MGPAISIIGLALGAAGTGLSYVSQMNAANTQATFSQLNAQAGAQQATQQASIAAMQANLHGVQSTNAQNAAQNNALATRQQADQDAAIGQANARRNRDEFTRQLAQVTAAQGGSGAILSTGSPLDLLMNAADKENQQQQDSQYGINAARTAGYRQAAGESLGAQAQGINASLFQLDALSDVEAGRMGAVQAQLGGLAGQATAAGMRSQAFGGLIGGLGGNLSAYANSPLSPWRPKPAYLA